jgi:hypothetical protein
LSRLELPPRVLSRTVLHSKVPGKAMFPVNEQSGLMNLRVNRPVADILEPKTNLEARPFFQRKFDRLRRYLQLYSAPHWEKSMPDNAMATKCGTALQADQGLRDTNAPALLIVIVPVASIVKSWRVLVKGRPLVSGSPSTLYLFGMSHSN